MPVTPTYPGIYIEEIQSASHTITAAPTNIAVFVGYSHPFLTLQPGSQTATQFGEAILLQSFTDYQNNFGGFFGGLPFSPSASNQSNFFASLPMAVYQFFLNGGTECYVVGLEAHGAAGLQPGSANTSEGINFTALQPTDSSLTMSVTITPKPAVGATLTTPPTAPNADIAITYGTLDSSTGSWGGGTSVEVYRQVPIGKLSKTINGVSPTGDSHASKSASCGIWCNDQHES